MVGFNVIDEVLERVNKGDFCYVIWCHHYHSLGVVVDAMVAVSCCEIATYVEVAYALRK